MKRNTREAHDWGRGEQGRLMFSYWSAVNQTSSHPHTSAHQYPRFRVLIVLFIFLKPETPLRSFSKLHQPPIISEVIVWTNCLKNEIIMKVNMKSDAEEIKTTYFCFALWKWKSATRVCSSRGSFLPLDWRQTPCPFCSGYQTLSGTDHYNGDDSWLTSLEKFVYNRTTRGCGVYTHYRILSCNRVHLG